MKRIIYCLDGTWNTYDSDYPTNVVMFHKAVAPKDRVGVEQLAYYDAGVGTAVGEKLLGGVFGLGLINNIIEAYNHLCRNYEPGDEIFIVGFSRGAYTARSFAGLIGLCGIVDDPNEETLAEALRHYKKRNSKSKRYARALQAWREKHSRRFCANHEDFAARQAACSGSETPPPIIRIKFVGVWDTVKTLGLVEKLHDWHDHGLSPHVDYARHAVALDERRTKFTATLWDNIDALNAQALKEGRGGTPYRQVWFPGGHGAVGGGGPVRGLSDDAFDWILEGAREAGLFVSSEPEAQVFDVRPNPLDWLDNCYGKPQSAFGKVINSALKIFEEKDREGPEDVDDLSHSAIARYFAPPDFLPEKSDYRPGALNRVAERLSAMTPPFDGVGYRALIENAKNAELGADEEKFIIVGGERFKVHVVKKGEWLSTIAKSYSGYPMDYKTIHAANRATIDDPDKIFVGQRILIPASLLQTETQAAAE